MSKIKLYIEATANGWEKTFNIEMDKPLIDMDDLIKVVVDDVFKDPTGIVNKFLEFYGIGINFIRTKSREDIIRIKRQELCYFLHTYSLMQDTDIGNLVGVNHATVLHGVSTVTQDMQCVKGYSDHINKIRGFIGLEKIVRGLPMGKSIYKKNYGKRGNERERVWIKNTDK